MTSAKTITLYLYPELRKQARTGRFNFVNRIAQAVEPLGYSLDYRGAGEAQRRASLIRPGYALFFMHDPFHDRALTMRKVYHAPFWAIEPSAKRWNWSVERAEFDPSQIEEGTAKSFVYRWRDRLFGDYSAAQDGHILVPLQGRLRDHRSFQSKSPMDMLRDVIAHADGRRIIATLHPNESYSPEETAELEQIERDAPGLSVQVGQADRVLAGARFVVTQNSSVAFNGYFFRKPTILYGRIDFHHIALNVKEIGVAEAFERVDAHGPDYDAYLYWFWQIRSINAGHPTAEAAILSAFRRGGWSL